MRPRISIRACVRPSVRPSVCDAFVKNVRKSFISPILSLPFNARGLLCLFNAIRTHHWPAGPCSPKLVKQSMSCRNTIMPLYNHVYEVLVRYSWPSGPCFYYLVHPFFHLSISLHPASYLHSSCCCSVYHCSVHCSVHHHSPCAVKFWWQKKSLWFHLMSTVH